MATTTTSEFLRSGRVPDKRPPYVRWTFYLLCICLALLIGVAGGLIYIGVRGTGGMNSLEKASTVSGELRRDLAGKLLGAGLPEQAVEQYKFYLSETDLPAERRANIAYTIGKIYMEQGQYEDALSWFYQVEMLDPKTRLGPEVGSKIVACLERLGRFAQAQYSLDARSSLDGQIKDEDKGLEVVAKIGNESISLRELNEAMDALPEWMRESLNDPAQKQAFLQQYVAEELLYRKAKKLELDKTPQMRKMADRALRQLLVQKVLEGEIQEKVDVKPEEVELFFQANRNRYAEKEAFKIQMIQVPAGQLDGVREALEKGENFSSLAERVSIHASAQDQGGEIDEWIEEGMDPTGMGEPGKLWETLSVHQEGEVAGPVLSGEDGYLFLLKNRRQPRSPSLAEVQKQVEQDIYRERVEKAYQELIRQALLVSDVKLYPEALNNSDDKQSGSASQAAPPK